jgi:hypothetical protein
MTVPLPVLELAAPSYSKIINRPIDNTALSAFMRCPSEYHKGYVLHRRNDRTPKPGIAYGSGWHAVMESHYKAPECDTDELMDRALYAIGEKWEDHGIADDHRTPQRVLLEYRNYIKRYGMPWKEDFKTIGWPETPFVELSGEIAIPGARHPYAFKIDRIGKMQSQYFIEDHKSTSRFEKDNFFRQFELDNQMMGYAAVAELITGQPIAGVRINAHVIHKGDSLFERRTVSFSRPRLDDWKRNLDVWLGKIEDSGQALSDMLHLLPHMEPQPSADRIQNRIDDIFPMNLWACHGRKYGSCPYVSVCSMPPHLRQRALEDDYEVNPWNPLESEEAEDA